MTKLTLISMVTTGDIVAFVRHLSTVDHEDRFDRAMDIINETIKAKECVAENGFHNALLGTGSIESTLSSYVFGPELNYGESANMRDAMVNAMQALDRLEIMQEDFDGGTA